MARKKAITKAGAELLHGGPVCPAPKCARPATKLRGFIRYCPTDAPPEPNPISACGHSLPSHIENHTTCAYCLAIIACDWPRQGA